MRAVLTAIIGLGALLLIAASMAMNWLFWTGQGTDSTSGHVLGAVSIGIDLFKATLPLLIARAVKEKKLTGTVVASIFFAGCLSFSFVSALGFAASTRNITVGDKEAIALRLGVAERDLAEIEHRRSALGAPRPQPVVEEEIAKSKQDKRWLTSKACTDATIETSRSFCRTVADLRIELAGRIEADHIEGRQSSLKAEIVGLVKAGARLEQDAQASLLGRLSGLAAESVRSGLSTLFAVLVELGAAFGLYFAGLARRPRQSEVGTTETKPKVETRKAPTRFVRSAERKLMIG